MRYIIPLVLLTGAAHAQQQQPAELRLGAPAGRIETAFSDVFGFAELPDGRVVRRDGKPTP